MGSRDHSEACGVCGEERGGLNDLPCACDGDYRQFSWPFAERLESLGAQLVVAGALTRAWRNGADECAGWTPGCGEEMP